jgi:hypothetical protein
MLSIRFRPENEWWVSGKIFDRLFQAALDSGTIPPDLEHWRHVADANGGFDLSGLEPGDADQLTAGLRRTAERELARLGNVNPASESGAYRCSLLALLDVTLLIR